MGIKNNLQAAGLRLVYDYIDKDPERNLPRVADFIDKTVPSGGADSQIGAVRDALSDPDGNWYRFAADLFTNIDAGVRRTLFENLAVNATLRWIDRHDELEARHECNIPWAILLDPTSACNLHCTGCWAAEYGNRLNLTFEEMDDIVRQGKELGVHIYLFTGGEPLVRKDDVIRLCAAHPDCEFSSFTNGTLIDETFAEDMLRVKNFIPALSVEGFEVDTDFRRGSGTFKKVERAMSILKERHLPFGISCCYTSKNVEMIGSEAYFDRMIAWGAKFCWFFTYMPVGNAAVPELMVSPQQRKFMYEQVRKFRETKPLFTLDFWNDGEYVGGCIAGGRRYLHINANGDIEPCAFIHYSDSNIREKTLLEALRSPLFMAYRRGQPFNGNHLRPCPLLDNPHALRAMVQETGSHSTDMESPEDVVSLTEKCRAPAEGWAAVADQLWACSGRCAQCAGHAGEHSSFENKSSTVCQHP
ncbi:MAG: radical SAM protein [Clostridia bacterium]|nr:radical SAM protein [Clostridia bacterium]